MVHVLLARRRSLLTSAESDSALAVSAVCLASAATATGAGKSFPAPVELVFHLASSLASHFKQAFIRTSRKQQQQQQLESKYIRSTANELLLLLLADEELQKSLGSHAILLALLCSLTDVEHIETTV